MVELIIRVTPIGDVSHLRDAQPTPDTIHRKPRLDFLHQSGRWGV